MIRVVKRYIRKKLCPEISEEDRLKIERRILEQMDDEVRRRVYDGIDTERALEAKRVLTQLHEAEALHPELQDPVGDWLEDPGFPWSRLEIHGVPIIPTPPETPKVT